MIQRLIQAIIVVTLVASGPVLLAQQESLCVVPEILEMSVGVYVDTEAGVASAPGSAEIRGQGVVCWTVNINFTLTLAQTQPTTNFILEGEGNGSLVATLRAPANTGSCYSSTMHARGAQFDRTASSGDTACWWLPPSPPPPPPVQGGDWCTGCSPILINTSNGVWRLAGAESPVLFDIDADGRADNITWTGRGEPLAFLALDRNSNGTIDNGAELFGNATRLRSGRLASNGFEALKDVDSNGDGIIDAADSVWPALVLWIDENHDGLSQGSEISRIAQSLVTALRTRYHTTNRTDTNGNAFRYESIVETEAGNRPYYDVFLRSIY